MNIITAHEFSKVLHGIPSELNGPVVFGIDKARAAATLRRLADLIESGGALLQKVDQTTSVSNEDFCESVIHIAFVEVFVDAAKSAEAK